MGLFDFIMFFRDLCLGGEGRWVGSGEWLEGIFCLLFKLFGYYSQAVHTCNIIIVAWIGLDWSIDRLVD